MGYAGNKASFNNLSFNEFVSDSFVCQSFSSQVFGVDNFGTIVAQSLCEEVVFFLGDWQVWMSSNKRRSIESGVMFSISRPGLCNITVFNLPISVVTE